MSVFRTITLFALAALAEIGGAWLVWQGVREDRGVAWIGAGIAALGAYGFVATFQEDNNFGRVLAAYGGIFVAGSLAWGSSSTGSSPTAGTTSVVPSASSALPSSCSPPAAEPIIWHCIARPVPHRRLPAAVTEGCRGGTFGPVGWCASHRLIPAHRRRTGQSRRVGILLLGCRPVQPT